MGLTEDCTELKKKLLKWNIVQKKISRMKPGTQKNGKIKREISMIAIVMRITNICTTGVSKERIERLEHKQYQKRC